MSEIKLAIIGGSGVYDMEALAKSGKKGLTELVMEEEGSPLAR